MRSILLCLLICSAGFAQDSSTPPAVVDRAGHSISQSSRQVELIVRFISVSEAELATKGVLPIAAKTNRSLALADATEDAQERVDGIQLVSSSTVVHRPLPVYLSTITEDMTIELLGQAQSSPRSNILFAPKVTMWDGQISEIRDTTVRPYVAGFKGTKDESEPQIEEIEDGMHLVVRPHIQADGSIRLNLAVRFSKVVDIETTGDENSQKRVQVPEVHKSEIKLSADVKAGHTLVIGGATSPRRDVLSNGTWGWLTGSNKQPGKMERASMILLLTPRVVSSADAN